MIISKSGTTMVEAMVVMVIVIVGVVGMYSIFTNSQKLSDSASYRLNAIAIAKEGIEAITNIRDTNWIIFASNTNNCWLTYNYNSSCIIADGTVPNPYTHIPVGSYILYNNTNNRHFLSGAITGVYSSTTYRNDFRVNLDNNGFYTQSGGTSFLPIFTREIKISYPADAGNPPQSVNIQSIVRWSDSSRNTGNYEIKLETLLTNWKKD